MGLCKKRVRAGMLNSSQSDTENWQELKDWDDGLRRSSAGAYQPTVQKCDASKSAFVIVDEAHDVQGRQHSARLTWRADSSRIQAEAGISINCNGN